MPKLMTLGLLVAIGTAVGSPPRAKEDSQSVLQPAEAWRAEHRIIDLHQHIDCTTQHLARAIKIMDAVGLGIAVNLSGATVSPGQRRRAEPIRAQQAIG